MKQEDLNQRKDSITDKPFYPTPIEISLPAALEKIDELEAKVAELEHAKNHQRELILTLVRRLNAELPSPKDPPEQYSNHIRALLLRAPNHRMTVKKISSRIGLSKQRTWEIVKGMEKDRRVNVINDPHHKQRKLVELHQQIG